DTFVIGIQNLYAKECKNAECNVELFWDDGTPFNFNGSSINEVTADSGMECFRLNIKRSKMKTRPCSVLGGGILCEYVCSGNSTREKVNCGTEPIPMEYYKVRDKFYKLMSTPNTDWSQANTLCSAQVGSHLPIIKDGADLSTLRNAFQFIT
ncbi:hypothetical protein TCAL_15524, partial [Tigriopus californicus]